MNRWASYLVIGVHFFLFLLMLFWTPTKKIEKKPLQIHTVMQAPPPPPKQTIAIVKQPRSTPASVPKKATVSKKPSTKKKIPKVPIKKQSPQIPKNLVTQLQESIAKIDQKSHKENPKKILQAPSWVPKLKIDEETTDDQSLFAIALVECLQSALNLPEVGSVKIELTLKSDGSFVRTQILESKSERNQKFLEHELQSVIFPSFSGSLKNEKEHTFVITFFNS